MRSRTLWILLLLIGIGLLALVLRHDSGTVAGFETGDFASLIYKIALLIFIGGAVLSLFRDRIAEAFQAAMFWVVIGLLLAIGYTYLHDLRDIGDRVLSELVPGRAASRAGAVEIARGSGAAVIEWPDALSPTGTTHRSLPLPASSATRKPSSVPT